MFQFVNSMISICKWKKIWMKEKIPINKDKRRFTTFTIQIICIQRLKNGCYNRNKRSHCEINPRSCCVFLSTLAIVRIPTQNMTNAFCWFLNERRKKHTISMKHGPYQLRVFLHQSKNHRNLSQRESVLFLLLYREKKLLRMQIVW